MAMNYDRLLVEPQGEICWVRINRPDDRNSIDSPLMEQLHRLLDELERTSVRAVVFTGAGPTYFIGGADGVEMMRLGPEGARDFSRRIQELFNRMERSPLLLVAAINGLCFGGGFEFALACDLRLAGQTARIGLPEVKVGIIPGGGGTQRLPRLIGVGRAMEAILSGQLYPAAEALELGLIHQAVPSEDLVKEAAARLSRFLRLPAHALGLAKRAVKASQYYDLPAGLEAEAAEFSRCFENDFFRNLMREQLNQGILATTARTEDSKEAS
ncbi:MAG: enoyl-CoA hydratase/isomerase family protein [Thermodesulfobacteriota bacterium]